MTIHRYIRLIYIFFMVPIFSFSASLAQSPQEGYTTETLKEPVYDDAEVAVRSMFLNNWLVENYAKLPKDKHKGPREELYYLANSHIKNRLSTEKKILLEGDVILATLFSWADRLGVYGGKMVYDRIKPENMSEIEQTTIVPDEFSLTMENDLLSVKSKVFGWQVKFPYYYMIGRLSHKNNPNTATVQQMIVSTGSAKDTTSFGKSQATLFLQFTTTNDMDALSNYWTHVIHQNIETTDIPLEYKNLVSSYSFAEDLKLHKEVVLIPHPEGILTVFYSGNDGTYQWNRPHFLDFLKNIEME